MKSIFIIGDSISLYYHLYLKKFLKNKALYYRKGNETEIDEALHESNNIFSANGGDSSQVIEYMEQMIKSWKITNVIDLTLSEIEAIGGCESADGYNMDSHCMEGTGRCYYGEFTAKNCISNRV